MTPTGHEQPFKMKGGMAKKGRKRLSHAGHHHRDWEPPLCNRSKLLCRGTRTRLGRPDGPGALAPTGGGPGRYGAPDARLD